MRIVNPTFGTDPEFGIFENGVPVQIIDFIPGSKKEPCDIGEGCGVQPDNVMIETTQPPTSKKEDFIKYFNYCKNRIQEIIRYNTNRNLDIVSISSATYKPEDIAHPIAQKFGCEPSFCIYTGNVSPRPSPEEIGNLRSAGFHLHIGFDGLASYEETDFIIFLCDILLGLPSIVIDEDENRRKLYGNAGDFRVKHLFDKNLTIVEYRTLGGAMHQNDELLGFCFDQLQYVVRKFNFFESMQKFLDIFNLNPGEIKDTIDTGNSEKAIELIKKLDYATYRVLRDIKSRTLQLQPV